MAAINSSSSLLRRIATFVAVALGLSALPLANAQPRTDPAIVEYVTTLTQIQEQLPFTRSYTLSIKSPFNIPAANLPISFAVETNGKPAGVSDAEALSYLSFSPATINFTGPNQTVSVTVSMNVPAGATPGGYGYKITAEGWPVDPLVGLVNLGSFINATVTAPPAHTTAPQVEISTPVDGSVVTVTSFPVSLPFAFRATATGATPGPITSASAELDGATVVLDSLTGLSSTTVDGAGSLVISAPGLHTVSARATNAGGTATDSNTFRVSVTAAPPTVVINTPADNSTFSYRLGAPALAVPFTFTATSSFGGVRTLTAKVDGVPATFSPSGLGTLTATGSINLTYTTEGTHTLEVTTTDDNGTATTKHEFTVTVIEPTPTIAINQPLDGAVINLPAGVSSANIAFSFRTTSNNGFLVDSVSAELDNDAVAIASTAGLGTATANSSGTLANVTAGTHTLTATGVSAGITVTDSVSFTVRTSAVPPSVAINTPPAGSVYTRVSGGDAIKIPLSFTGTSNTSGAVIKKLTASLNGRPLSVSTQGLYQKVANGTATLCLTNAGTYTISVAAVDAHGTATATRTFKVVVVQGRTIAGEAFFDADFDGRSDCGEFGLSGITVKLYDSANQVVATDTTDACGNYSFRNIAPGDYVVSATAFNGISATTLNERDVTVGSRNVCVPSFGFGLNFSALKTMTASGNSHGFWKGNVDKAIAGKSHGAQVSKSTLYCYADKIGDFALSPYNCISLKTMSSAMSYNGSNSTSLLSKQLIAAELNYQHGAYINGNRTLTFLFLWWGEFVMANPGKYSSSYTLWAKDWMDAYNNSHGGKVNGPSPR